MDEPTYHGAGGTGMRQIVLESPGNFGEREAPAPIADSGSALVQVAKVGVCGSDFHAFAGRHPIYTYPRIIGHELSGVVVKAPANEYGIHAGDRCAIEPYITCGRCRACAMGRNNCCENIQILGIHVDGGLQEYLSVPLSLLHKSSQLSLDQLALIETLAIGAHAVNRSGLEAGQEALVVGAGPIGIAVAQFASALGGKVHIVEKSEWRRAFVQRMGYAVSPTPEGRQADAVFDATGSAAAMSSSLQHVATGGSLVYVGLTRDPVSLDDALFHRKEVTLLASRNSFGLFPKIIQLIEEGKIDTSHWITDHLKLSDVASQFQALTTKQTLIKAIVDVNQFE
ncbi:MAG: zinc-binding alcohol dehydrogenase family protein [Acidobacteriaceae bacterium]